MHTEDRTPSGPVEFEAGGGMMVAGCVDKPCERAPVGKARHGSADLLLVGHVAYLAPYPGIGLQVRQPGGVQVDGPEGDRVITLEKQIAHRPADTARGPCHHDTTPGHALSSPRRAGPLTDRGVRTPA